MAISAEVYLEGPNGRPLESGFSYVANMLYYECKQQEQMPAICTVSILRGPK